MANNNSQSLVLNKRKKTKRIFAIITGVVLAALGATGIGLSSYYVSQNVIAASDLSEGRSIQLNLELINADREFLQDINKEEKLLKESSDFLVSTLESKSLTNISVTYGFQYQEIEAGSAIELTANNFDLGLGQNLSSIIDSNQNVVDRNALINLIFTNKNKMFFNASGITDSTQITVNNLEANFTEYKLSFNLSVANTPIANERVHFFGFNGYNHLPDFNPTITMIDNSPKVTSRFGLLTASFESSQSSFSLKDIEDEVNELYNDSRVYRSLSVSNRYSLEPIWNQYVGITASTGRTNSNLFVDSSTVDSANPDKVPSPYKQDLNYYLINDPDNYVGKIEPYVDKDKNVSTTQVNIESHNTYNSGSFVIDKNEYNKLLESERGEEDSGSSSTTTYATSDDSSGDSDGDTSVTPTEPVPSEQYNTTSTWILWNDKEGFLNYLNQLIIAWYFNLYANIPFNPNGTPSITSSSNSSAGSIVVTKDNWEQQLFNTDTWNYANYINRDVRSTINNYISSLETVEKQFMAYIASENNWLPEPIDEDNLIATLYNFYMESIDNKPENKFDSFISSPSEIAGWGWIESDAEDNVVKQLASDYIVAFIDYRNYESYFVNPNPPDTEDENYKDTDPIHPFYINDFTFASDFYSAELFADLLTNDYYRFPLVTLFDNDKFLEEWRVFVREFQTLGSEFKSRPIRQENQTDEEYNKIITEYNEWLTDYNKECADLANKYLKTSYLFSQQNVTKPKIDDSITGLPPLTMLFIVISAIIFLVGVFVSIRYRIPGFITFMLSSLTFVLSLFIYSNFSFAFSFFSLISAAIGSFISFFTGIFFFNNFKKEIKENSSITGSTIKSIKKYWKTSLDIHIVLVISALAFLFFGQINNINFGAMLIVSTFLSFILSGIIFYCLMLLFVVLFEMNHERLFMTNREYKRLLKLDVNNKQNKFISRLNSWFIGFDYFSKPTSIIIAILMLIGIVGIFIFIFVGPVYSLDFTTSNIIMINNFSNIGLTKNEIINLLGISTINNYVYDDQLIIYASSPLGIESILDRLYAANITTIQRTELVNSVSSSILSSEINIRLVLNTLKCIGIAIGFSSIWVLVSLNIISIVPIFLSQLVTIIVTVGVVGITRMPFDINGIVIFVFVNFISLAVSVASISSVKKSWNRKINIDAINLKSLLNSILKKINKNFIIVNALVLAFAVIGMVLVSPSLIFTFLILIVGSLINMLLLNRVTILTWYYAVLLVNKFTNEINSKEKPLIKPKYDDINEQMIKGLNC